MPSIVDALTQINLDDLVKAFGWENKPLLARLLRRLAIKPALILAHQMANFDSTISTRGLVEASRQTVRNYLSDLRVFGADRIPASAFLALSNHPGLADALSVFTALNRPDLHVIAQGRLFLDTMPNVSNQLFYLRDESASRVAFVRQVSLHLRNGGAVLTFPAGRIEPDPDVHEGAVESLQTWTDSVGVFVRRVPEAAVLPVLVRGVVWDKAAHHWLTKFMKTKEEKNRLAAALQSMAYVLLKVKPVSACVQIGKPIYAKDLGTTETQVIHQALLAEMIHLIENQPEGEGESIL